MGHVVILMGSPRPEGNTAQLCKSVAAGASLRHQVTTLFPCQMNLKGCTGCNACFRSGEHRCVQRDDMEQVYQVLSTATVLVLATPLYFYGPSAQLKCLIDRLHNPIRDSFPIQKLALLAVAGNAGEEIFAPLVAMYHTTRNYFGLRDGGVLTVGGVRRVGDIRGHQALEEAYHLGTQL